MLDLKRQSQRGDTLIEVLIATAILSAIVVIAAVLMNRGMASSQVAVETTIVRQTIDSQAEMLRYLSEAKINDPGSAAASRWDTLISNYAPYSGSTPVNSTTYGTCPPDFGNSNARFYLSTNTAQGVVINAYPNGTTADIIAEPGRGLWIEATRNLLGGANSQRYTDFHIRACWAAPSSGSPQLTMGTVVRLYVP